MDAPHVVWMPGSVRTEIHLVAEDTGGAFCLLVDHPPAGWSLPAHLHHGVAETVHAGGNVGTTPGRRIVIFTPAGMENFFLEAGTPSEDPEVALRAVLAAAARHGWQFIT